MIALYKEVTRMITEQKIDRSVGTPLTIKPSFSAGEMNVLHFHNFYCLMLYDKAAKIRKNPRTSKRRTGTFLLMIVNQQMVRRLGTQ